MTIHTRNRLTLFAPFCIFAFVERVRKGSQERAVNLYSSYFAFTYRFSFTGERAGETRAGKTSS